MSEDIVLNRELLKAIGADTRIAILKALRERRKTQSELAKELGLAVPTVLEHLDHLENVGLIQKIDEGRKWKYYKLTKKGGRLSSGTKVHAVVLLGMAVVAVIAVLVIMSQFAQPVVDTSISSPVADIDEHRAAPQPEAMAPSTADAEEEEVPDAVPLAETVEIVTEEPLLNETNQTGNFSN